MSNVVALFPEQQPAPCECFVCHLRDLDDRLRALSSSALLVTGSEMVEMADALHDITHRADAYVRRMEPRETKP
jgi:hypothetical protein